MPRIKVNEKDLSWYYRQRNTGALTVYVPGVASFGPEYPTLCDGSNFKKYYGTAPSAAIKDDISYEMAASFIKSGANVLFDRICPQSARRATAQNTYDVTLPVVPESRTIILESDREITLSTDTTTRVRGLTSTEYFELKEKLSRLTFMIPAYEISEGNEGIRCLDITANRDPVIYNYGDHAFVFTTSTATVKDSDVGEDSLRALSPIHLTVEEASFPTSVDAWILLDRPFDTRFLPGNREAKIINSEWYKVGEANTTGTPEGIVDVEMGFSSGSTLSTFTSSGGVLTGTDYDSIASGLVEHNIFKRANDPTEKSWTWTPQIIEDSIVVTAPIVSAPGQVSGALGTLGPIVINAKYKGVYGNNITVEIRGNGFIRYFYVYEGSSKSTLLESFTAGFNDPMKENYYENVNDTSQFIEIEVLGEFDGSWQSPRGLVYLSGGSDGIGDSDALREEIIGALETPTAFEDLKDLYSYDIDLLTCGGYNKYYDPEGSRGVSSKVDEILVDIAKSRGDCVCLVDGKESWDFEEFFNYCGADYLNTSYAAAYGPWGHAQYTSTGARVFLPGSYALVIAWCQSIEAGNPKWMAPAGTKRSQLGSFYKVPAYEVGKTILDLWQNQDYVMSERPYCINPIMRLKQYGYCIYGNSTLLRAVPIASSMLQLFSVRVMSNMIKRYAFDVSLTLQFDQLTNNLVLQFKTLMSTYLDQLRYQGALYDYQILVDSSVTYTDLNTRRVPVRILISPTPTAENFDITLEISQAGVTFADGTDETEIN